MRTNRGFTFLAGLAAALGVGLIAFSASASAAPPVVPTCALPATAGSDSCVTGTVDALDGGIGSTLEPVRVGVRTRSVFDPATSETNSVTLRFDDDIALNLAGIPACPSSELTGRNISAAYEQCGPGADGNPPSEGNAFLSAAGNVSGIGSTIPDGGGAIACTLIFKGANNNQVTLYARAPVADATTGCNNPATHTGGTTTVVFTGNLTHQPASSAYDWTLTVNGTSAANPALDDFYATLSRGNAFRARCPNPTYRHRLEGVHDYTAPGDPTDTHSTIAEESKCGGPPAGEVRPNTKITNAKINQRRHKAKFKFKATRATATRFECNLKGKRKATGWKRCSSPKTYKRLKRGRYKFKVRAIGPGGKDNSPATDKFRIKRRR